MLLEIKRVVDPGTPPSFRITPRDGTLQGSEGSRIEDVPPRPRHSFSRVDFYLDVNVPNGATKQDVIDSLTVEREAFVDCLAQGGLQFMQDGGHYSAQTLNVSLEHQSYKHQAPTYYADVFDACIQHLTATPLTHLP